jgi:hypothetical protein
LFKPIRENWLNGLSLSPDSRMDRAGNFAHTRFDENFQDGRRRHSHISADAFSRHRAAHPESGFRIGFGWRQPTQLDCIAPG